MVRLAQCGFDMQRFDSDGIDISYLDEGEGDPVLLIHGFASNAQTNWVNPGWVAALKRAGHRVIAMDNRGHGQSGKPHDPAFYEAPMMAEDARRLLEHLNITRADVMGYSMGARITAFLSLNHPARARSAVFGGLGLGMVEGVGSPNPIVAALEAGSLADVIDPVGRAFRKFADATASDLKALAACMRSARQRITREQLGQLSLPVLVAVGTRDEIAGSAQGLADLIAGASVLDIPDRDHMLAVGDRAYKEGVLAFLGQRP